VVETTKKNERKENFLMKGIILAGGSGTRLFPMTTVASKQLQPVYDKPMVYYPFTTLIENGVRDICLISTPTDLPSFERLLGNGKNFGVSIQYREQPKPEGIAQAFLIAEDFIDGKPVALILGDNIFNPSSFFQGAFESFNEGAAIFGYQVKDPCRYGVVEVDAYGKAISIEEKPENPKSDLAVPGIYIYDEQVVSIVRTIRPSKRGELEITAVNQAYLERDQLKVHKIGRGFAWLDAGTPSSLHEAASYVRTLQERQGIKIGCPEEAALRKGILSQEKLGEIVSQMPKSDYRAYLERILQEVS
jgi:glucose-1-phosphate thymidylyltransferase